MDEIITNKIAIIKNCLKQAKKYYKGFEREFDGDFMRQDAVILNLQRACEASIDLALRMIRLRKLGLPQDSRGAFVILEREKLLSSELSGRLQNMVGFRNIAVHDYQKVNLEVVKAIMENRLSDFEEWIRQAISLCS